MNTSTEAPAVSYTSGSLRRKAHLPLTKALKGLTEAAVTRMINNPQYASGVQKLVTECSAEAPKLFSSASTYTHGALQGKKTKKCFTGKLWGYRDGDFDREIKSPNNIQLRDFQNKRSSKSGGTDGAWHKASRSPT
jgi:hypothetical protein